MKIIVTKNYDEMSIEAGKIMTDIIKNKPDCVLGLATGSTPVGMYDYLTAQYEAKNISFKNVSSINLDEYYPITPDNDQSYRYFMNVNLFDRVDINKDNTFVPNGTAEDVEKECKEYDQRIEKMGIDVQILGIGRNGHIGFNEPAAELNAETHLTELTPDTINANARFFASEDEVPKHALTLGLNSMFKARKILLLASGKNKAEAIRQLVATSVITTACPATLLRLHTDVTVICDEDAYSLV
jgi:glucosamine-6-phosphate deaminase